MKKIREIIYKNKPSTKIKNNYITINEVKLGKSFCCNAEIHYEISDYYIGLACKKCGRGLSEKGVVFDTSQVRNFINKALQNYYLNLIKKMEKK